MVTIEWLDAWIACILNGKTAQIFCGQHVRKNEVSTLAIEASCDYNLLFATKLVTQEH